MNTHTHTHDKAPRRVAALVLASVLVAVVGAPLGAQTLDDEAENRRIAAQYDRALDLEPRDDAWASSVEAQAREAVVETAGSSMVWIDTRCATNFCRATLELETAESDSALDDLVFVEPFATAGWIRVHDDGSTVSLYFVREGRALPSTEPSPDKG